jgi:D-alanyl-D-alanine carboxypeptidase
VIGRARRAAGLAPWALASAVVAVGCVGPVAEETRRPAPSSGEAAPATEPGGIGAISPELVADIVPPARPPGPMLVARLRLALVDDPCTDRDLLAPAVGDEAMTILDRTYALPPAYAPGDLVPASEAGLTGTSGTKLVRAAMLEDLAAMRDAWAAAGLSIGVESAYRTYAAQQATFDSWVARVGVAEALRRTARPGHSEHQLGTALDLTSPGWAGRVGDWASESAEGAWMVEHGWKHGFVMSYPAGSEAATCFGYEPWHWRWIGRDAAAAHRDSGLPLREFLVRSADG